MPHRRCCLQTFQAKTRKTHQLSELTKQIQTISEKCRFILDIINDDLVIQKQPKQAIIDQLTDKQYKMVNDSYDYLVKLPIYTLSQEEIDKLLSTKQELESEYQLLSESSIETLWLDELKIFEKLYKKMIK